MEFTLALFYNFEKSPGASFAPRQIQLSLLRSTDVDQTCL